MANFGTLKVTTVKLNGVEFLNAWTNICIYEDMYKKSVSGYIDVMESEQVREWLPIIGEEYLELEFASMKTISMSPDESIWFHVKIYNLTEFQEGVNEQKKYRLHFQTMFAEMNRTKRCRKVYRGTGTSIAAEILKKQIGKELQTIDAAKYSDKVIFPNWTPFRCIDYLCQKSISEKYNDPAYVFYEDRDGYHMTTFSEMMDRPKVATVQFQLPKSMIDENRDLYQAYEINFSPMFDVLENEVRGMYGGTLLTFDKVHKKMETLEKTYSETFDQFKHVGDEKLDRSKAESPKNMFQFMSINADGSPGQYTRTNEWVLQEQIRRPQLKGQRAMFNLNRATNLKVGDVIEWEIRNAKGTALDKLLSGKWLITRMKHNLKQGGYSCHVEVIKDGLG